MDRSGRAALVNRSGPALRWRIVSPDGHNRFMVTRRSREDEPSVDSSSGPARLHAPLRAGPATDQAEGDGRATGPSLTVAAVARRLGVAPATLRTWDRRYGLGPSEHLAGSHRRYSGADVSRLLVMRRLTLEGVAPSEAARSALDSDEAAASLTSAVPSPSDVIDAFSDAVPMAPDPPALVAAAGHFDNAAVRWMLARVQPRDVLAWWSELVEPALRTLQERAVLERPGESAVPALTAAVFAELRSRAAVAAARSQNGEQPADGKRVTVLVLPVGHGPDLLVHVLATALQGYDVRARVLAGGRPAAVAGAVERLSPAAVVLDVGSDDGVDERAADVVRAVLSVAPAVPLFVHRGGGSGTLEVPVAATIHRVRTLTGALHEILAAVS
ncbi:MAG: MerR family transcriptional regulator [Actinotalea sp.]|nr:MerR family transcriptional regulator [Actinotalea sp.]